MKRSVLAGLLFIGLILCPAGLLAAGEVAEADALYQEGGLENYQKAHNRLYVHC